METISSIGGREWLIIPGHLSDLYFFAYGANMNAEMMRWWEIRAQAVSIARLPNHKLSFHGHSKVWDGGMETIVPDPGSDVWGVLYALSFMESEQLDSALDVRLDGGGTYFHYPTKVIDAEGNPHWTLTYKKDVLEEPTLPSGEYLKVIVNGAAAHGLPADYVESLRSLESKPAGYPVPKRRKFSFAGSPGDPCSACGV